MTGALSAHHAALVKAPMRYWLANTANTSTDKILTNKTSAESEVTSFVWSRNSPAVATVTTPAEHMLLTGDKCTLDSANNNFDVTAGYVTRLTSTTFTVELGSAGRDALIAGSLDTVTVNSSISYTAILPARSITLHALKAERTNNVGTVYIGCYVPTSGVYMLPVAMAAASVYDVPIATGASIDLSEIGFEVATANDGVIALFH